MKKVSLKPFVHVFKKEDEYIFYDYGNDKNLKIETPVDLNFLIKSLNNNLDLNELNKHYANTYKDILKLIAYLHKKGYIYIHEEDVSNKIMESLLIYCNSKISINKLDEKFDKNNIAIIGLGGTGSWVFQELIMNNVKNIKLIDCDVIEESNLQRQTIYQSDDIGKYKVDVLENYAKSKNKNLNIAKSKSKIGNVYDCENELLGCDLIICTADEPSATEISTIINTFCMKHKKTMVSTLGYTNAIINLPFTYLPNNLNSPCVKCHYNENNFFENYDLINKGIGGAPLTPIAAILGSLISLEVINLLIDTSLSIFNTTKGTFNSYNLSISKNELTKDPKCYLCSEVNYL